jgi:large conductance mechanosensitive channel
MLRTCVAVHHKPEGFHMSLLQEFKEFAVKGNAVDMAVGIIIGAAFTKVVNSIVNDLIMPPLGMLLGGVDFKHLQLVLKEAIPADPVTGAPAVAEVAVRYGMFISNVVDFLIVAWVIFLVVRGMNRLIRRREAKEA